MRQRGAQDDTRDGLTRTREEGGVRGASLLEGVTSAETHTLGVFVSL